MIIKQFITGQLENNTYLILDEESRKGVFIDANALTPEMINASKDYDIEYILLTHGHFDHILALNDFKEKFHAKALINENDQIVSDNLNGFTMVFGMPEVTPPKYDKYINDNEEISVGNLRFQVITTPGHTEGGVCYLIDDKLFSGDTLFRESVGRTDLFGGNFEKLSDSVKNKLFKLDEDITVYPGHGASTTIGHEKQFNEIL